MSEIPLNNQLTLIGLIICSIGRNKARGKKNPNPTRKARKSVGSRPPEYLTSSALRVSTRRSVCRRHWAPALARPTGLTGGREDGQHRYLAPGTGKKAQMKNTSKILQ